MAVHGADYAETAQEFIATYAMIETAHALSNLDAILDVPEIDGVYIGPSDLGLSLGCKPTLMPEDKRVIDAIETIRSKVKAAGKTAGIHCGSGEMVRDVLDGGFDLATLLNDLRLFTNGVSADLAVARAARAPKRQRRTRARASASGAVYPGAGSASLQSSPRTMATRKTPRTKAAPPPS
jgi:4-hydroxy-2-oxoheptanedioate aldolase